MRIKFLGGADEIGASSAILELGGNRFLIDAGMRMQESERGTVPDFSETGDLNAVFLTHAHTDHSGGIPVASRYLKPEVPIYMTHGTFQLCSVLFADSLKIFESEGKALFGEQDIERTVLHVRQTGFFRYMELSDSVRAVFFPAGHILGAACVYFESKKGNVLFTGDFSVTNQLATGGAQVSARPDVIVAESTYGGRRHIPRKQLEYECILKVKEVVERGGKVLIPAFAVGRSQEMILLLKRAVSRNLIPKVKIYTDGLVNSANRVYDNNPRFLPHNLRAVIKNQGSLFYDANVQAAPLKREKLLRQEEPLVIISSSGMLVGGPSVFYAKEMLKHEKNALLISGYQDEESPGRKILNLRRGDEITLDSENVTVKAEVCQFSLSAHADEIQIANFVNAMEPSCAVLVHGDNNARGFLAEKITAEKIHLPLYNETLEFPKFGKNIHFDIPDIAAKEEDDAESFRNRCLSEGIRRVSKNELQKFSEDQIAGLFTEDWMNKNFYRVLTPEEHERYLKRKHHYENIVGDITGRLVIYSIHTACYLGLCIGREDEHMAYWLVSSKSGKAKHRIDAEKIVHICAGDEFTELPHAGIKEKLRTMHSAAVVSSREYRRKLVSEFSGEVSVSDLMNHFNPGDLSGEIAVIYALVPVAALSDKGPGIYVLRNDSLMPEIPVPGETVNTDLYQNRLLELLEPYGIKKVGYRNQVFILRFDSPDPSDKDEITARAKEAVPDFCDVTVGSELSDNTNLIQQKIADMLKSSGLKKVSCGKDIFTLQYDFPEVIDREDIISRVSEIIPARCSVCISETTNQTALLALLHRYTGPDGRTSLFLPEKKVVLTTSLEVPDDFRDEFFRKTGFTLSCEKKKMPQQEILETAKGLVPAVFRKSVKFGVRGDTVLIKADFPDVLLRDFPDLPEKIRQETGMEAEISQYPNTDRLVHSHHSL